MFVIDVGNACVADGDTVAIAGQVRDYPLGVVHAGLGVDHPVSAHQLIEQGIYLCRVGEAMEFTPPVSRT